jgi:putative ABC transport system permease protein
MSFAEANMADFVVDTEPLPQNITDALVYLSNVKAVEGRLFITTTFNYLSSERSNYTDVEVWIFGVDVPLELDLVKIVDGRFFSQNHEEALVGGRYFGWITGDLNEEIEIIGPLGNSSFPLVGIFKSMWIPPYGAGPPPVLLMPIRTAQEIFGFEDKINSILVQVTDKSKLSDTIELVKNALKDYRIFSVRYEGKILPQFNFEPYLLGLTYSLRIVGVLTILVGGALIYNILDLAVSEEYREIGTFKALGFTNRQVLSIYMIRGLLLGIIGSVVGAFLGLWLGSVLLNQYTSAAVITHALLEIDYTIMFTYAGLEMCLVALCSLPSALRAFGVAPYLAISQGREVTSQKPPKTGTSRLSGVKIIPGGYAFRSLLRKKTQATGMITVLAISTILYATSIAASQTFIENAEYYFEHEYISDINVNILTTEIDATLNKITNVEGVRSAVPIMGSVVWTEGFSIMAVGIPPDPKIRPSMISGEMFVNNESVAVLTEFVVREMNLHVGDNITLSTLYTVPNNITVRVIGIARDIVVNAIFLPLEKAHDLFSFSGMVLAMIQVEDDYDITSVADNISRTLTCYPFSKLDMKDTFYSMAITPYASIMVITILLTLSLSLLMITTIVMMNVNERRREFATLKAVGVTPGQIRNSVLIEILVVGTTGCGLGIILSIIFVFTLIKLTSVFLFSVHSVVFPFESIALSVVLSLFTSLLSGFIPALSASKTRTAEALRYE